MKRYKLILLSSLLFLAVLTLSSSTIFGATWDDGKVSYWNLDTDGSIPDSWGSNTGTIDGVTYTASGHINGAYIFDGGNDQITVSNDASLNNAAITISAWIKCTESSTYDIIIAKRKSSNIDYQLHHTNTDNTITFHWSNPSGTVRTFTTTDTITNNVWTHVALTHSSSGTKIYINNHSSGSGDTASAMVSSDASVSIGHDVVGSSWFEGQLDEVAIFNRSLTASEIDDIYTNGLAPSSDTCTAPAINNNWEIDLSDDCVISTNSDIGTGNITFINTGTITFNATIDAHDIGGLPANQHGILGIDAKIRVGG